jgi:hypothetical protein
VRVQFNTARRSTRRASLRLGGQLRQACAQVRCAAPRMWTPQRRRPPRETTRHAPRQVKSKTALAPRRRPGETHSESGMRLRSIFVAAKNHASPKNALSSRQWLAPRRQRVTGARPGSAGRICRWRGAALVASRGRCGKALRSASLPCACAPLSWLAAWQPSLRSAALRLPPVSPGARARALKSKPPRAAPQQKQTAPSSGAKKRAVATFMATAQR